MKKYWLYVLKLDQGKYYVGVTSRNVSKRVDEHRNGFMGAKWTKRYKPIRILDKKDLGLRSFEEAEKYETRVTIKYMDKYGVNNVRGGLLTSESDYFKRFGLYFEDIDYMSLTTVTLLVLIVIMMVILYYTK